MRARVGLLSFVLLASVAAPPVARADGGGDAYIDPEGNPTVEVIDNESDPGSDETGGGDSDCYFRVAISDDFVMGVFDIDGNQMYSETGRWLELICDGSVTPINGQGIIPEGGGVDPRDLAATARQSVSISDPPIATSPDADRETYAQVTTWLWVENSWWTTYSATASAGRVSATVTAMPTTGVWTTGDGGNESCDGPGVVWQRGREDSETYCSHVYRRSSEGQPDGQYELEVTVAFDVTWTSNAGPGGTLEGLARTSNRNIRVSEIQAIETE